MAKKTKKKPLCCHSTWEAIGHWSLGNRAEFFKAINGYRPFEPAPWTAYLWLQFMKEYLGHSAG